MIELKNYQRTAVHELKERVVRLLNFGGRRNKIVFKAPTGSGKTVMVSAMMDELQRELKQSGECQYTRVAWVWIAPNKLHQQSYRSMRNFFSETRSLRPVMFDECEHLEGLRDGEVLFLNWESINKDNAVLIRDNEQNRTLYELLRRTRIENKVPVVVIIDEEHMFGGRNAVKSEKVLANINPDIELRVSATPITGGCDTVVVQRQEVVDEEMIKKGVQLNPDVKSDREQSNLTVNQRLLKRALAKREELAKALKEYGINPLLLVQLPNDSSESMSREETTIAEEVKQFLSSPGIDISEDNGGLAVWLSKEKSPNLGDIVHNDDPTRVLLFKQAIALGWDCPRAAVLLIFRELKSMTFTTQTVGRILRMPQQHFYNDERLNYGYVYTNLSADIISVVGDDMNYISSVYANRREGLHNIELRSVYMDRREQRNRLGSGFKRELCSVLEEKLKLHQTQLFDPMVLDGELEEQQQSSLLDGERAQNREKARKGGLHFDVTRIFIEIPQDTQLTGADGEVVVVKKAKIARNSSELDSLFTLFCRNHVGSYARYDSTPVLRGALLDMMETYFDYFETEAIKVLLYSGNRAFVEELINSALSRYGNTLKAKPNVVRDYSVERYEIPATRIYNSGVVVPIDDIFNHALRPYFEQHDASKPERDFARWIDRQTELVDWWYKNGDEGKQHFAIPYTDSGARRRCFYVDFIIRLKNGSICLFDTKTPGSDEDTPEKNNALWDYVQKHNEAYKEKNIRFVGGVLVQKGENWYYPGGIIENDDSIDGWTRLELDQI
ncbi:MAG: DEAD/DEAH box helicase family protein [Bacteroidales bacterium]|nr:DEAD/DEAH box helicase family protein [Bacteroidales bacterium]